LSPDERRGLTAGAVAAFAGTFLVRYVTAAFTNDHFVHLSRAQQIVLGDLPIRDFFDPGLTLQYYASAGALVLSGHNLFGEAILTSTFIAAGVALTFVAATRLSRSYWLASVAAVIAAMSMPRLYNYPKAFLYVLAIVCALRYSTQPGLMRLLTLAMVTAVAFLFRHDHGVYIGVAAVVLLTVRHWPVARAMATPVIIYGAITLALLAPFLFFVQATVGLVRHARSTSNQRESVSTLRFNRLPITFDRDAPLLAVAPPSRPRINIRWADGITDDVRRDLERRHALLQPAQVAASTWSYVPARLDTPHIAALINDPAAADTHGIDRARSTVDDSSRLDILQRRFPVLRLQVAPGLLTRDNALAWFYYVTFLLPVVGVAIVVVSLWRGEIDRAEAASAAMTVSVCLIVVQTLVRGSPDSRLPDVAGPIAVLGAWVAARWIHVGARHGTAARRATITSVALAGLLTVWSVTTNAAGMATLEASGVFSGPAAVVRQARRATERLRSRPIANWSRDASGLGGVARYVFECTAPGDRLLAAWFAPQVFFYAERAFAGGQVYLIPGWHDSPDDQRLTVERLQRQRVPIVLESDDSDYETFFPIVAEYIHSNYRAVALNGDRLSGYRILLDRRLPPTRTYEPLGVPCYR
jgi:hypothetical protein